MNKKVIDKGSTLLLRASLLGIAGIVALFGSFMLANVYSNWASESPELAGWRYPVIFVITAVVITFFVALGQIWRLLGLVSKNKAFSKTSVKTMRNVKYCGLLISGLFATWMPLAFHVAQNEDAPGMVLIFGVVFVSIPFIVAIFAGVAQQLFQNAIDIKSENDLTV